MYGPLIYNDVVLISLYKTIWEKIRLPYLFHLAKTSRQSNRLSFKFQKHVQRAVILQWRVSRTMHFMKYYNFENTCSVFFFFMKDFSQK